MKVTFEEMKSEFKRVLQKKGFDEDKADMAAQLIAETSADGILSHGINRFPRVIQYIDKGYIKVNALPTKEGEFGAFERWNGNLGLGNLNAKIAMDRAIQLAKKYGIGCVALRNTNHWLRGGSYGWQAANAGCIGICWTNTQPNMPAWGAKDRRIGNNPLILAIPRENSSVVVDAAMSQFSYGKIENYKLEGKLLPVPGGFDMEGNMTTDPEAIEKTWRVLPIGYWKGSGLSIVMDLMAAALSGGNSSYHIGKLGGDEYQLSQVFIVIDVTVADQTHFLSTTIEEVLKDIKDSEKAEGTSEVMIPGESVVRKRKNSLLNGIEVNEKIWDSIKAM